MKFRLLKAGDFDIVFVEGILYFVKGVLNPIHVHLQEVSGGGMGAGMGYQGRPDGGRRFIYLFYLKGFQHRGGGPPLLFPNSEKKQDGFKLLNHTNSQEIIL